MPNEADEEVFPYHNPRLRGCTRICTGACESRVGLCEDTHRRANPLVCRGRCPQGCEGGVCPLCRYHQCAARNRGYGTAHRHRSQRQCLHAGIPSHPYGVGRTQLRAACRYRSGRRKGLYHRQTRLRCRGSEGRHRCYGTCTTQRRHTETTVSAKRVVAILQSLRARLAALGSGIRHQSAVEEPETARETQAARTQTAATREGDACHRAGEDSEQRY